MRIVLRPLLNAALGLSLAMLLAVGLSAAGRVLDPCPECYQCSCVNLCCDGSHLCGAEAECERWTSSDDTCNRKGGCSWECPGGSGSTYCCGDYCSSLPEAVLER